MNLYHHDSLLTVEQLKLCGKIYDILKFVLFTDSNGFQTLRTFFQFSPAEDKYSGFGIKILILNFNY